MDLSIFFNQYIEDIFKIKPIYATFNEIHKYDDTLPNFYSDNYKYQLKSVLNKYYQDSFQFNVNNKIDIINITSFRQQIKLELNELELPFDEIPINQINNIFITINDLVLNKNLQLLNNTKQIGIFKKRMTNFPDLIEHLISKMNKGIKNGRVLPRKITIIVIQQLKDILEYKPYLQRTKSLKINLITEYQNIFTEYYLPSLKNMINYLEKIYLSNSRNTIGLCHIPQGKEMYYHLVRLYSGYSYPNLLNIYNIGLKEIKELKKKTKKNCKDKFLNNEDKTLEIYTDKIKDIQNTIIPKYFGKLKPENQMLIRKVPEFKRKFSNLAYYKGPSFNSKNSGCFFLNFRDLKAHPLSNIEVLCLHEGYPGHHYQISLARENKDIPLFRSLGSRQYTGYIEGWGLYSESLGEYKNLSGIFGKNNFQLLRCLRLVIDIGIHFYGWSYEKSINIINKLNSETKTENVTEINRYISIPGQALSYKLGEMSILKCRNIFLNKIGNNSNNLIKFHKKILDIGPLQLDILEQYFEDI